MSALKNSLSENGKTAADLEKIFAKEKSCKVYVHIIQVIKSQL